MEEELVEFILSQANDNERLFTDNLLLNSILNKAKELKNKEMEV